VFITESTFGLPIYKWKSQQEIFHRHQGMDHGKQETGKTSVLIAYSLGKAQRVMQCIKDMGLKIFLHGAVWNVHQTLLEARL
jgi:putative mRNA 3-end processing factor